MDKEKDRLRMKDKVFELIKEKSWIVIRGVYTELDLSETHMNSIIESKMDMYCKKNLIAEDIVKQMTMEDDISETASEIRHITGGWVKME